MVTIYTLYKLSTSSQLHEGIRVSLYLSEVFGKHSKNRTAIRLTRILNSLFVFYYIFQILLTISMAIYIVVDFYLGYWNIVSVYVLVRFAIISPLVLYHVFHSTILGVLWLQLYAIMIAQHFLYHESVKKRLEKIVAKNGQIDFFHVSGSNLILPRYLAIEISISYHTQGTEQSKCLDESFCGSSEQVQWILLLHHDNGL